MSETGQSLNFLILLLSQCLPDIFCSPICLCLISTVSKTWSISSYNLCFFLTGFLFNLAHNAVTVVDEVDCIFRCITCRQRISALYITVILAFCRHDIDRWLLLAIGDREVLAPSRWTWKQYEQVVWVKLGVKNSLCNILIGSHLRRRGYTNEGEKEEEEERRRMNRVGRRRRRTMARMRKRMIEMRMRRMRMKTMWSWRTLAMKQLMMTISSNFTRMSFLLSTFDQISMTTIHCLDKFTRVLPLSLCLVSMACLNSVQEILQ